MTLHHLIEGPADAPAVLLVNGLLADLSSWQGAMPYLAAYRVLRFDGLGQGLSPKPLAEIYPLAQQVELLLNLLEQHGWPACHVVGLSHGGVLAMALAAAAPGRVRSLTLAACLDRVEALERLKLESWLAAHLAGGGALRFDIAAPWVWSRELVQHQPEILAAFRARAANAPAHAVTALIRSALAAQVDVRAIALPALVLAAEDDLLTPPRQLAALAERLPRARFQTIAGAHAALLEKPELFASHIIPFWREVDHVA